MLYAPFLSFHLPSSRPWSPTVVVHSQFLPSLELRIWNRGALRARRRFFRFAGKTARRTWISRVWLRTWSSLMTPWALGRSVAKTAWISARHVAQNSSKFIKIRCVSYWAGLPGLPHTEAKARRIMRPWKINSSENPFIIQKTFGWRTPQAWIGRITPDQLNRIEILDTKWLNRGRRT